MAAAALASASPSAAGLPSGGRVESGSASIASGPDSLVVTQSSHRLAMGWDSFSIGAGRSVEFVQPSSSALAVNVVRGSDPSVIAGNLSANGRVVLVNPQGIAFAAGSQVNVGSLVASALRDASGDFASGRTTLSGVAGEVLNAGVITVARGGSVLLAGSRVTNTGLILADAGKVALAAGSSVALDFAGDSLITLSVDAGAVDAAVANGGAIRVGSGQILLTARAADGLAASVVRNSGELQASSIIERGGEIWLSADVVENSGVVSATSSEGQGGEAHLLGAASVSLTGMVDVTGGSKGGFVDVSAPAVLLPDLFQVKVGRGGHFLLDPDNILISAAGSPVAGDPTESSPVTDITLSKFSIEAWLAGGSDLTIEALNGGTITVASPIVVAAPDSGALSLVAGGDIDIQQPIFTTGSLSLAAGGDLLLSADVIAADLAMISGGDLWLRADAFTTFGDLNFQVGGNLVIDALGGIRVLQSEAGANPVVAGSVLTNVTQAQGGSRFALLADGGDTVAAVGWLLAEDIGGPNSFTLGGDVRMQYGFRSGFSLPTTDDLAFVPDGETKYPDPYAGQEGIVTGLRDGDTLADVFTAPNLAFAWTGAAPTATSPAGSTFGYTITLGEGFSLNRPGYLLLAVENTGTLTVRPRELLAKPDDLAGTYGSYAKPAKYLYQLSGFQNGDTSASLGITGEALTGSAYDSASVANRGAGTYAITIGQNTLVKSNDAAGNYAFNFQDGSLVIGKAPLTLTADDQTREYGEANPELTLTPTGLAYDDSVEGSLTGSLSLTTSATATTNVGNHLIDLGIGTAVFANYDVTLVDGTLAITKAPLAIAMEDATKVYGDPLAAGYPYVMTGFKNGETEVGLRGAGALSGTVLVSTPATQASPVGTYVLSPLSIDLTATNYAFTSLVPAFLTVIPRGLVVSASPEREYGLSNDPANITWNTLVTGFVNGDTQASVITGEPILIGVPDITANAGNYAITLGQGTLNAGPNYDLTVPATTYNDAIFTVAPATSLRFVADNQTREYGLANPAFTWTVSGFRNGDTSAVLSGSPTLGTTANALSNVGSYAITIGAGTLAAANYTVNLPANLVNGTLTVTKAPLVVAAVSTSRAYGEANPTLQAVVSGFRNGQSLGTSGVTGSPLLTTDANLLSPVGDYVISTSSGTLASNNYSFSFVDGSLAVTKAPLTVTANNASRVYGSADTFAGYVISGFRNGETEAGLRDAGDLTGEAALSTDALLGSDASPNAHLVLVSKGSLDALNYDFDLSNYVSGVYEITKATLTIRASDKSREYGDPNPALEYTLSGFKLGETTLSEIGAIGLPALSTEVVPTTSIGQYAVTASVDGMVSVNYEFVAANGTLTITRAPLALKVSDATTEYGDDFAGFVLELSGFKNGETEGGLRLAGALSGSPVFTYTNSEVKALDVAGSPRAVTVTSIGSLLADNYSFTMPATPGSLTVTPAPVTLRAAAITRTYGEASTQSEVDGSWDIAGLKNGQTRDGLLGSGAVSGAPVVTSAQALDALLGAGTYGNAVTAANGTFAVSPGGNYSFDIASVPASADLVVDKALITVGVHGSPLSKLYGAALPSFSPSYTGFKNGQDLASSGISGTPVLSTVATASSNVGPYAITVNVTGLSAANYTFSGASGILNITKAPLTVTADAKTREYGLSNPTLTATLSGFVLGQNLATSGVTGSAGLSTTALPTSGIGSYPITAALGTLSSGNYSFDSFVDSSLTITRAPLTARVDDQTKVYGDANPALTFTWVGLRQGDTAAVVLGGIPALSTTVTNLTGAGTYAGVITANIAGLTADNYTVGSQSGSFLIQKATLLGSVDAATRSYGYPNPSFAVTWTGYKNGDTAATSGFAGSLVFSTEANPASPVAGSPYAVSAAVGTYSSPNYSFGAIAPGLLTVERGNLWENEVYNLAAAPLAGALRLEEIQARLRGQPLNQDPQARIDFDKFSIRLLGLPSATPEKEKVEEKAKAPANSISAN